MKPVIQTRFGRPLGNCWAASIASVLELPLEAVDWSADMPADEIEPPGATDCSAEWIRRRVQRLRDLGFWEIRNINPKDADGLPRDAHYLMLGTTTRGVGHVVVGRNGRQVHDPNPDGLGLADVEEIIVLAKA